MSKRTAAQSSAAVGRWKGEEIELAGRYTYREDALPLVFARLGIQPGMRILDVGAGSGYFARKIARHVDGAHVTALDADADMLDVARRKVREEGLARRVRIVPGDAYDLPFPDAAFDAVTSHHVMCILNDPQAALREQMRVAGAGGTVSAVICFCRTDRLPRFHGRWGLPGDHRIDWLDHRLNSVWRTSVRPRLLDLDHDVVSQDVLWHFRAVGLEDVRVDGHLAVVAPGDDRIPVEEAAAYAAALYELDLKRLRSRRDEHGRELAENGFTEEDFEELIALKTARLEALQDEPHRVREVMEAYAEPMLILHGKVPA